MFVGVRSRAEQFSSGKMKNVQTKNLNVKIKWRHDREIAEDVVEHARIDSSSVLTLALLLLLFDFSN